MAAFLKIWAGIALAWSILKCFKYIYWVIGFFTKKKVFPPARRDHTYGIIIAARNEERVIGNLLDSIRLQDYDQSLLKVFVVADNCTDNTAQICRDRGAIVYERHDPTKARKGWALEYLFEQIDRDYGIGSMDAYLFFDADNLLSKDFITQINKAFDSCGEIVVGYRNTKNFDTNFISAGYGLHFFSSTMCMHRPREFLRLSTHIAGTGYAVASDILSGGWHWTCLTEDTQFCLSQIAMGRRIEFCEAAEFFDEQPYTVGVMVRQRLRWVKGRLVCFFLIVPKLFIGLFRCPKRKFSCVDMFFYIIPNSLIGALKRLFRLVRFIVSGIIAVGVADLVLTSTPNALPALLAAYGVSWLRLVLKGAMVAVRERRHIRCSTPKLIFYTLLWPFFDISGRPIALAAILMRVKWKPIRHDKDIAIAELETTAK